MNEQWKQLKDTIVDIRDNNEFEHGDVTLMCRFLVNYMEVLEKQMQEPCKNTIDRQAVLDIVDSYSESQSNVEDVTQDIISDIVALPPVNSQPQTGRWIYGEDNLGTCRDGWYCNQCGHFEFWDYSSDMKNAKLNLPNPCPNCGAEMVEPQKSEG